MSSCNSLTRGSSSQTLALKCTTVVASVLLFSQKRRGAWFFVAPGSSPDGATLMASVCVQRKFLRMNRVRPNSWAIVVHFVRSVADQNWVSDDRFLLGLWTLAARSSPSKAFLDTSVSAKMSSSMSSWRCCSLKRVALMRC